MNKFTKKSDGDVEAQTDLVCSQLSDKYYEEKATCSKSKPDDRLPFKYFKGNFYYYN